ncbi:MAG: hypothetical protein AAFX78_19025, partial [Cyanobacteria bacterium J06638_20]
QLATLKGYKNWVSSVAFSGDGQTLASASEDQTVRLWSVATHQELTTLKGHEDWVRSVAFSGDGQTLASASYDKTVRLWSVATGHCIAVLDHRLCAGLDITGALGLTDAQRTALKLLGAIEDEPSSVSRVDSQP